MFSHDDLITLLDLKPLPKEGGWYRETYRSQYSTAIYYLLTPGTFSALHRLPSDEVFHFYLGDKVIMLLLYPDSSDKTIELGPEIEEGQQVQVVVPKGVWQGCLLDKGGEFALMGTTVAPPFEFSQYEAGQREALLKQYPSQKDLIMRLTRA